MCGIFFYLNFQRNIREIIIEITNRITKNWFWIRDIGKIV